MGRSGTCLSVWVGVPETCRDSIAQSGDAWVTLMFPIAMAAGDDSSIAAPVDSLLLENLRGLMAVWHYWFPALREAGIEAPSAPPQPRVATRRGMFFSGGVYSFFTLLRHDKSATGGGDRKSTRLNSSPKCATRMPSSA